MKAFLFGTLLVLISTASFTIWVDPAHRWHRDAFDFSQGWPLGQVFKAPANLEERHFRLQHISALEETPDIMVFGSSRSRLISQLDVLSPIKFFNASVAGGTVFDMVWVWQSLVNSKKVPEYVVLYTDTWLFNKNTWAKYRWVRNSPLVKEFIEQNFSQSPFKDLDIKMKYHASVGAGFVQEITEPINLSMIKRAYIEFSNNIKAKAGNSPHLKNFYTEKNFPEMRAGFRWDGSYLEPKGMFPQYSLEQITAIAKDIGKGSLQAYLKNWETDYEMVKLFQALLNDMTKRHVKVFIIHPPFQHTAYGFLKKHNDYKKVLSSFDRVMSDTLENLSQIEDDAEYKLREKIHYCNKVDPELTSCGPTEFQDSSHTHLACARRIFKACLQPAPDWSAVVPPKLFQ